MKYLLFSLIGILLSNCNTSTTVKHNEITTQKMKDSSYFSNGQLSYKKEGDLIRFYTSKGVLYKEMNLLTRIEKRFDHSQANEDINDEFVYDMGAGYYCYPDAKVHPAGSKRGNILLEVDVVDSLPKNDLGYPRVWTFNKLGLVTETPSEKIMYDDLGRITSKSYYSDTKGKAYKNVDYRYEDGTLKTTIHTGNEDQYNYKEHFIYDDQDRITKVLQIKGDDLIKVLSYEFSDNKLQFKKTYRKSKTKFGTSVIVEVVGYRYDDQGRRTAEMSFFIDSDSIKTLEEVSEGKYDGITAYDEYRNSPKSIEYIYQADQISSVEEKDLSGETPVTLYGLKYKYNKNNQLVSVESFEENEVKAYFSYFN